MAGRRTLPEIGATPSPSFAVGASSFDDSVRDELSQKMLSWVRVWFGSPEGAETTAEQHRVRERLLFWVKRCIGVRATAVFTGHDEDVSLATSTPLLTALLGRRAMLELSRRVLKDS